MNSWQHRLQLKLPCMQNRGFTLIELVMTIAIMGIMAAVSWPMMDTSLRAYTELSETTDLLGKLRYAMERMAREVRETDHNGSNFVIGSMTAGTLSFTKRDGTTVTLSSSGSNATLQYSTPAVTSTLTDQLNSLAFAYYQSNGSTVATNNSNISFVEISLTLAEGSNTYPQRTRIALRNSQ